MRGVPGEGPVTRAQSRKKASLAEGPCVTLPARLQRGGESPGCPDSRVQPRRSGEAAPTTCLGPAPPGEAENLGAALPSGAGAPTASAACLGPTPLGEAENPCAALPSGAGAPAASTACLGPTPLGEAENLCAALPSGAGAPAASTTCLGPTPLGEVENLRSALPSGSGAPDAQHSCLTPNPPSSGTRMGMETLPACLKEGTKGGRTPAGRIVIRSTKGRQPQPAQRSPRMGIGSKAKGGRKGVSSGEMDRGDGPPTHQVDGPGGSTHARTLGPEPPPALPAGAGPPSPPTDPEGSGGSSPPPLSPSLSVTLSDDAPDTQPPTVAGPSLDTTSGVGGVDPRVPNVPEGGTSGHPPMTPVTAPSVLPMGPTLAEPPSAGPAHLRVPSGGMGLNRVGKGARVHGEGADADRTKGGAASGVQGVVTEGTYGVGAGGDSEQEEEAGPSAGPGLPRVILDGSPAIFLTPQSQLWGGDYASGDSPLWLASPALGCQVPMGPLASLLTLGGWRAASDRSQSPTDRDGLAEPGLGGTGLQSEQFSPSLAGTWPAGGHPEPGPSGDAWGEDLINGTSRSSFPMSGPFEELLLPPRRGGGRFHGSPGGGRHGQSRPDPPDFAHLQDLLKGWSLGRSLRLRGAGAVRVPLANGGLSGRSLEDYRPMMPPLAPLAPVVAGAARESPPRQVDLYGLVGSDAAALAVAQYAEYQARNRRSREILAQSREAWAQAWDGIRQLSPPATPPAVGPSGMPDPGSDWRWPPEEEWASGMEESLAPYAQPDHLFQYAHMNPSRGLVMAPVLPGYGGSAAVQAGLLQETRFFDSMGAQQYMVGRDREEVVDFFDAAQRYFTALPELSQPEPTTVYTMVLQRVRRHSKAHDVLKGQEIAVAADQAAWAVQQNGNVSRLRRNQRVLDLLRDLMEAAIRPTPSQALQKWNDFDGRDPQTGKPFESVAALVARVRELYQDLHPGQQQGNPGSMRLAVNKVCTHLNLLFPELEVEQSPDPVFLPVGVQVWRYFQHHLEEELTLDRCEARARLIEEEHRQLLASRRGVVKGRERPKPSRAVAAVVSAPPRVGPGSGGIPQGPTRPPTRTGPWDRGNAGRTVVVCGHCNYQGHSSDDCWAYHPDMVPEGMRGWWAPRNEGRYALYAKRCKDLRLNPAPQSSSRPGTAIESVMRDHRQGVMAGSRGAAGPSRPPTRPGTKDGPPGSRGGAPQVLSLTQDQPPDAETIHAVLRHLSLRQEAVQPSSLAAVEPSGSRDSYRLWGDEADEHLYMGAVLQQVPKGSPDLVGAVHQLVSYRVDPERGREAEAEKRSGRPTQGVTTRSAGKTQRVPTPSGHEAMAAGMRRVAALGQEVGGLDLEGEVLALHHQMGIIQKRLSEYHRSAPNLDEVLAGLRLLETLSQQVPEALDTASRLKWKVEHPPTAPPRLGGAEPAHEEVLSVQFVPRSGPVYAQDYSPPGAVRGLPLPAVGFLVNSCAASGVTLLGKGGQTVRPKAMMVDCGASVMALTARYVKQLGLQAEPYGRPVYAFDGGGKSNYSVVRAVPMVICGGTPWEFTLLLDCLVMEDNHSYDMLCGVPFLYHPMVMAYPDPHLQSLVLRPQVHRLTPEEVRQEGPGELLYLPYRPASGGTPEAKLVMCPALLRLGAEQPPEGEWPPAPEPPVMLPPGPGDGEEPWLGEDVLSADTLSYARARGSFLSGAELDHVQTTALPPELLLANLEYMYSLEQGPEGPEGELFPTLDAWITLPWDRLVLQPRTWSLHRLLWELQRYWGWVDLRHPQGARRPEGRLLGTRQAKELVSSWASRTAFSFQVGDLPAPTWEHGLDLLSRHISPSRLHAGPTWGDARAMEQGTWLMGHATGHGGPMTAVVFAALHFPGLRRWLPTIETWGLTPDSNLWGRALDLLREAASGYMAWRFTLLPLRLAQHIYEDGAQLTNCGFLYPVEAGQCLEDYPHPAVINYLIDVQEGWTGHQSDGVMPSPQGLVGSYNLSGGWFAPQALQQAHSPACLISARQFALLLKKHTRFYSLLLAIWDPAEPMSKGVAMLQRAARAWAHSGRLRHTPDARDSIKFFYRALLRPVDMHPTKREVARAMRELGAFHWGAGGRSSWAQLILALTLFFPLLAHTLERVLVQWEADHPTLSVTSSRPDPNQAWVPGVGLTRWEEDRLCEDLWGALREAYAYRGGGVKYRTSLGPHEPASWLTSPLVTDAEEVGAVRRTLPNMPAGQLQMDWAGPARKPPALVEGEVGMGPAVPPTIDPSEDVVPASAPLPVPPLAEGGGVRWGLHYNPMVYLMTMDSALPPGTLVYRDDLVTPDGTVLRLVGPEGGWPPENAEGQANPSEPALPEPTDEGEPPELVLDLDMGMEDMGQEGMGQYLD